MIDTNELRRLAQAATPHVGHACKYQDAHWLREGHVDFENADLFIASERPQEDAAFYAAANPAAVSELLDRLEAAEKEVALKERVIDALGSELNAVANERDALRAELAQLHKEADKFGDGIDWIQRALQAEAKIEAMEKQEPAGTLHDDGYFVWRKRPHPYQSNYAGWKMALYALPGAKGETK